MRTLLTALMASAALTLAACGDDDASTADGTTTPAAAETTPAESTPATSTPAAAEGASSSGDTVKVTQGECAEVEAPPVKDPDTAEPKGELDASKTNTIQLKTSCGTIDIELDAETYPKTANAVATLVKQGYWDDTVFHRVVPGFVIQGGDPTGSDPAIAGSGGPSWKVVEAPKSTEKYPEGTLAMAKTGADAPGTTQSQFFIMVGPDGLPPEYAVAGRVTKGMDAAKAIEALGSGDGPPSRPAVVFSATFSAK